MDFLRDNLIYFMLGLSLLALFVNTTRNKKLLRYTRKLNQDISDAALALKRSRSELASVRVRHGQAWEVYLPLMETYLEELGDKNDAVFLGRPIDLIYFNKNEVVFVEIKTGNSGLSQKQKRIRKLIKDKKVVWKEVNDELPRDDKDDSTDTEG